MRHIGQVHNDRMTIHIFAEGDGDAASVLTPFFGFQELAKDDFRLNEVRHLHADGAFSGNGSQDVDTLPATRGTGLYHAEDSH